MLKVADADISPILKNPKPVLAVFFADWCPFCTSFLPEFERVISDRFELAEVDISDWDNPLWEDYKVEVVPTLIAFDKVEEIARRDGRRGIGLDARDIEDIKAKLEAVRK